MTALSGPWADVALLLRQAVTQTHSYLPLWLFGLLLFLSVCLLLLQLIMFLSWKLRQAEADLAEYSQGRSSIYRQMSGHAHLRRRRSEGSRSHT